MVIYSGFSTRRQQEKYNHLIKELLHLLSQLIITCVQSNQAYSFRSSYEKIQSQLSKMQTHKYSDFKVSLEIQPLTNHMLAEIVRESFSEPPKKKIAERQGFRVKRKSLDEQNKTIDVVAAKRRSSSDAQKQYSSSNFAIGLVGGQTMEELMRMHPLIERKMSGLRKKRYLRQQNRQIPLIREEQQFQGEDY